MLLSIPSFLYYFLTSIHNPNNLPYPSAQNLLTHLEGGVSLDMITVLSTGVISFQFGQVGDIPMFADFFNEGIPHRTLYLIDYLSPQYYLLFFIHSSMTHMYHHHHHHHHHPPPPGLCRAGVFRPSDGSWHVRGIQGIFTPGTPNSTVLGADVSFKFDNITEPFTGDYNNTGFYPFVGDVLNEGMLLADSMYVVHFRYHRYGWDEILIHDSLTLSSHFF